MTRARGFSTCVMLLALAACGIDDLKVQVGEAGQGGSTARAGRTGSAGKPAADGGKGGAGSVASADAGKSGSVASGNAGKGGTVGGAGSGGRASGGAGGAAAGQGGSAGASASAELLMAVTQYVDVQCAKLAQCVPFAFQVRFQSDMQRCRTRSHLQYDWIAGLSGTGWNAENLSACTSAQQALSCRQFMDDVDPPECQIAGTRQNGEACNLRDQCASRACVFAADNCGVCAAPLALGANCQYDFECPETSSCVCPDGASSCTQTQCLRLGADGAACGTGSPCGVTLNCGMDGRCHAPPDQVGATCSAVGNVPCDTFVQGLTCTAAGTCQKLTAADDCNGTNFCQKPGSICKSDTGTCEAPPTDGGACASDGSCLYPATCLGGKCVLPADLKLCQ